MIKTSPTSATAVGTGILPAIAANEGIEFIGEKTVAELLHVSVRSVRNLRWIKSTRRPEGSLGYYKFGRRVYYDRAEVLRWRAAQRQAGNKDTR
jgi:hypothetical protein